MIKILAAPSLRHRYKSDVREKEGKKHKVIRVFLVLYLKGGVIMSLSNQELDSPYKVLHICKYHRPFNCANLLQMALTYDPLGI